MTTGFGDAAIVADSESNRLLVMMVCGRTVCWNGRWTPEKTATDNAVNRVARVYATYNETIEKWEWTEPVEVTNDIYTLFLDEAGQPTVSSLFIGSGKICQSRVVKRVITIVSIVRYGHAMEVIVSSILMTLVVLGMFWVLLQIVRLPRVMSPR